MRIGFFSDSYFPEIDGVSYTLKVWRDRLEERGHKVYIIYPDSDNYEPGEREIPVKSVPNPFYEGYNIPIPVFTDLPELDVVHCHSPAPIGWKGRIYAHRNNIPSVYTHHTPLEEYFVQAVKSQKLANLLGKIYVPLEEKFLSTFDRIISNTEEAGRSIDTVKLDAGVDMEFFKPTENSFDWDLEKPIIGYSGRISPEKNIDHLLRLAEDFDGSVVIVGEGPVKNNLEKEAPENLVFKDFLDREKLPEYYSMLDVFVTASTGDTLGLSPLEANACGTPVVAPDVHPFDKTIQKEENGLRYKLNDKNDFLSQVQKAISREWNTRAAVEKYSVKSSIDKLERIYSEIGVEGNEQ